jgi:DNA-binding XRE family transcriptional regulator
VTRLSLQRAGLVGQRSGDGARSSDSGEFVAVHGKQDRSHPGISKCGFNRQTPVQCGARFRHAREATGWSQDRTAREWGCVRLTIISWELGRTIPPADALIWIESMAKRARRTGT